MASVADICSRNFILGSSPPQLEPQTVVDRDPESAVYERQLVLEGVQGV